MYYFLRAWQWEVGYYLISLPKNIIIITLLSLVLLILFNPGELQKNSALNSNVYITGGFLGNHTDPEMTENLE